jgi:hypothetical protein
MARVEPTSFSPVVAKEDMVGLSWDLSTAAAKARLRLHTAPPHLQGGLRANVQRIHVMAGAHVHRAAYSTRDRPPINFTDKPCG